MFNQSKSVPPVTPERAPTCTMAMARIHTAEGPPWNEPVAVPQKFTVEGTYDCGDTNTYKVRCKIHYSDNTTYSPGAQVVASPWKYLIPNTPITGPGVAAYLTAELEGDSGGLLATDGPVQITIS